MGLGAITADFQQFRAGILAKLQVELSMWHFNYRLVIRHLPIFQSIGERRLSDMLIRYFINPLIHTLDFKFKL